MTPQVRINPNTYKWEVSTDGGLTWVEMKGSNGQPVSALGEKGEQGERGDAVFKENGVTVKDGCVEFTLANGTVFTVPLMDNPSETIDKLLNRIQSLVYVPKTGDGKIHLGTSYIRGEGQKINVSNTQKIEYRVSPAMLRDSLLKYLLPEHYSFWQEHVTRDSTNLKASSVITRAGEPEHDGLHEFNVLNVEQGNGPGELLITVNNNHDFTHEDLAVALCIRYEDKKNDVLTEITSSYTTVVGEGSDLTDRFYVARKEGDTYTRISRDNHVEYTLAYDETDIPITLMEGYEVVYDNGETVMSLEDAKKKFEWDAELSGSLTPGIQKQYDMESSTFEATRGMNVTTFSLKTSDTNNIGKTWTQEFKVMISNKTSSSIQIGSVINADVLILPSKYEWEAEVTWNYQKWEAGKRSGWMSDGATYTSSLAKLKYNDTESSLSPSAKKYLFVDGTAWSIENTSDLNIQKADELKVTATTFSGDLAFAVSGFKYCEGDHKVTLTRSGSNSITTSGGKELKVSGTLTFKGPAAKEINLNDVNMSTDTGDDSYKNKFAGYYPLIYLSAENNYPTNQRLPYTKDDIDKFFDGNPYNVTIWMYYAKNYKSLTLVGQKTCPRDGTPPATPESATLVLIPQGGRPSVFLPAVCVKADEGIKTLEQNCTFNIPEGLKLKITDGPEFPITGSFTFKPKN